MLLCVFFLSVSGHFNVGVGKADVTGPIVEIPFMGYGEPKQTGLGLHLRQYCRAFVIQERNTHKFSL